MRKLATKLTPAIKAWIKEEFGCDYYDTGCGIFHFPNNKNHNGFLERWHLDVLVNTGYTKVSEYEFLAEFGKPKVEYQFFANEMWFDVEFPIRIKPTPDYSKEIEALQAKAKENGMKVTINFEKL